MPREGNFVQLLETVDAFVTNLPVADPKQTESTIVVISKVQGSTGAMILNLYRCTALGSCGVISTHK